MVTYNHEQFIAVTTFHQHNLNSLLTQYIDLPEAAGILAVLIYLQKSNNAARDAHQSLKKEKEGEQ